MLRVEFHCHTIYSKDSLTKIDDLLTRCHLRGIDRLVITDHNTIAGARNAQKIDPELIIIGEEIMTREGELLAAYVKEDIPKGLDPFDALERLHAQDAFISVSHPFDRTRSGSWQPGVLSQIVPHIDALEIFNARCFPPKYNHQAAEFAHQHNLPGTAGSDAHALFEVGQATVQLPEFDGAQSLRQAIKSAKYDLSLSPLWVRLTSRYAVIRKKFPPFV